MAALDFPASPALNQLFGASNGVVYRWNGTLWLAVTNVSPASPGGDFFATYSGQIPAAAQTIIFPTVATGNAGNWYDRATGRFTPPAGRYHIFACLAGSPSAGAGTNGCVLRKNAILVLTGRNSAAIGSVWAEAIVDCILDANGTDWFDIQCEGGSVWDRAGATSWFGAYPVSGIKGPPGDAGAPGFRLIQRIVPVAAQSAIDFQNIPADINDLELRWDVTAIAAAGLVVQLYGAAGALDNTASHYPWTVLWSQHATAAGSPPAVYNSTSQALSNGYWVSGAYAGSHPSIASGIRGHGTINGIRDPRYKSLNWQTDFVEQSNTYVINLTGSGNRNVMEAATGVRVTWGVVNNFAAGGSVSLWGSP